MNILLIVVIGIILITGVVGYYKGLIKTVLSMVTIVVSAILISGIGGLTLTFGKVTLTSIACALILGIITNLILSKKAE